MKKKMIIVIMIFALLCGVAFVIGYFLLGSWSSNNINKYIEATERKSALPELEDMGEYSNTEFKYYRKNMLLFTSEAYTLKASYNTENYQMEKQKLLDNYIFESEIIRDYGGYDKEPRFEHDTFDFKLLSFEKYELQSYPHEMIFMGFSDEKNEIAIVYYLDSDLDYIEGSFAEFLTEECGWK